MNSSMAPSVYKKPPQLPPKFTATPDSLIKHTQALVRDLDPQPICRPLPLRTRLPFRELS